jgi:hypothetical protein
MNTAHRVLIIASAAALAAGTIAAAQNALDNNLSTSGRTNYARPKPAVSKDIYTLNRATGSYRHNRANAFNDPVYSIYQRHTSDRFDAVNAAGVSTGSSATNPNQWRTGTTHSAGSTSRRSALGTSVSAPTRAASSSSRSIAPAYHKDTYTNGAQRPPSSRSDGISSRAVPMTEIVPLAERRGEYAPPRTNRPEGPIDSKGYSVADETIWPWLAK